MCVCMCAPECGLVYVSAVPMKPERILDPLELELQVLVSCPWVPNCLLGKQYIVLKC